MNQATHDLNNFYIGLGLEALATPDPDDIPPDEIPTAEDLDGDETVEGELLETQTEGAVITEELGDIDDLTDDAETLEDVSVAMESALNSGNRDQMMTALQFARITQNRVNRRWNIQTNEVVSMEGLTDGDIQSELIASMEGVKDFVGKIWTGIWAKLKAVGKRIKDWWAYMRDAVGAIRKRANAAKARLNAVGKFDGGGEMKLKAGALVINGQAPAPEDVLRGLSELGAIANNAFNQQANNAANQAQQMILQAIERVQTVQPDGYGAMVKEAAKSLETCLETYVKVLIKTGGTKSKGKDNTEIEHYESKHLLGDKVITARNVLIGNAIGTIINNRNRKVDLDLVVGGIKLAIFGIPMSYITDNLYIAIANAKRTGSPTKRSMVSLSDKQSAQALDTIIGICDDFSRYEGAFNDRLNIQSKLLEKLEHMTEKKEGYTYYQRRFINSGIKASLDLFDTMMTFNMHLISYLMSTAKHAVAYINASIPNITS